MRAADLKLDELVEFSEGWLGLRGRRLVLHSIHAFAQLRKDLVEMVGLESARHIFTRFGYFWGQADAAAMKRIFVWDDLTEWIKAGPRLHTLQGVAHTVVKSLNLDPVGKSFAMELVWHNSAEAEEHAQALASSTTEACWMLTGYASGYSSFCLGTEIIFIEHQCAARGHRSCQALGKDRAAWGAEADSFLTYLQAEDIHSKVIFLTNELKEKTAQLASQNRKIQNLITPAPAPFVEAHSEAFRQVLAVAQVVAAFDTAVLITGETGTGKEVLARYIHRLSPRAQHPFLGVNCGALPETLLESELFGHKAGSFTGALRDRIGLFEEAKEGTIFLDEIGDISPATQLKILRVLQEREVRRVGESKPRPFAARILTATNRNLTQAISEGRFREDLFYRLRVVEIEIPPLRKRREDIVPLARYFVQKIGCKLKLKKLRLDARCLDILLAYAWPGNVRELENAIEHAAVFSQDGLIMPEYLPTHIVHARPTQAAYAYPPAYSLQQVELEHIRQVLAASGQNRAKAAQALGISPVTLWRKLKAAAAEGSAAQAD